MGDNFFLAFAEFTRDELVVIEILIGEIGPLVIMVGPARVFIRAAFGAGIGVGRDVRSGGLSI